MNRHQRSLQANVKNWNEPKQIKPKSQDPGMSRGIKVIYVICILYVCYVYVCLYISLIDYHYFMYCYSHLRIEFR